MTPARALVLTMLGTLAACSQSMTEQARYKTQGSASLWADNAESRALPEHAVAQGDLERDAAAGSPPPATPALLARGRERYEIFCTPCHGLAGDGDGSVVQRGFPAPPSYHEPRLRAAPAQHFFEVITNGYGLMYAYGDRVPPQDAYAIIAYIRALQLARAGEKSATAATAQTQTVRR